MPEAGVRDRTFNVLSLRPAPRALHPIQHVLHEKPAKSRQLSCSLAGASDYNNRRRVRAYAARFTRGQPRSV